MKNCNFDSNMHKMLARDLYNVTKKNKLMLPEDELKAGEVKRVGTHPVGGSAEFDLWEGLYLENEKCILKVIRAASISEGQRRVSVPYICTMYAWLRMYFVASAAGNQDLAKAVGDRPGSICRSVFRHLLYRRTVSVSLVQYSYGGRGLRR